MWDAATGVNEHTFEGHDAPVYSVCPHRKGHIQVSHIHIKSKFYLYKTENFIKANIFWAEPLLFYFVYLKQIIQV